MKTLKEMDDMVLELVTRRKDYDEKKKTSNDAYVKVEEQEFAIIAALQEANKKSYKAEGLGTFSIRQKLTVTTPKTQEDKDKLYNYLKEQHGEQYLFETLTINHQRLQTLYKEELEASSDPSLFQLPGIDEPKHSNEASFRKA